MLQSVRIISVFFNLFHLFSLCFLHGGSYFVFIRELLESLTVP